MLSCFLNLNVPQMGSSPSLSSSRAILLLFIWVILPVFTQCPCLGVFFDPLLLILQHQAVVCYHPHRRHHHHHPTSVPEVSLDSSPKLDHTYPLLPNCYSSLLTSLILTTESAPQRVFLPPFIHSDSEATEVAEIALYGVPVPKPPSGSTPPEKNLQIQPRS